MITFDKFNIQNYSKCFVVTDGKLSQLYNIVGNNVFLLPQGEEAKRLQHAEEICRWLLHFGAEKDDVLVAIGGGSIGDVTGFAASVYKRGIKLLHVPTTLIAQIDSSIGGKTAVNLDGVKNAVGTFYRADTLIDVDFLKTLDAKQRQNGNGELLKYRMLDKNINEVYLHGNLTDTIKACVAYKQQICEADPFDTDKRKVLNFGHTVGHALELSMGLSHGEAVASGLYYETLIAVKLGLCSATYLENWRNEILRHFPLQQISKQHLQLTAQDKKNACGKVCLVLPCGDQFVLRYLPLSEIVELLCND